MAINRPIVNTANHVGQQISANLDSTRNCPNCQVGIMPLGMTEGLSGASILKILEQDGSAIHVVVQTATGPVEVMANTAKVGEIGTQWSACGRRREIIRRRYQSCGPRVG